MSRDVLSLCSHWGAWIASLSDPSHSPPSYTHFSLSLSHTHPHDCRHTRKHTVADFFTGLHAAGPNSDPAISEVCTQETRGQTFHTQWSTLTYTNIKYVRETEPLSAFKMHRRRKIKREERLKQARRRRRRKSQTVKVPCISPHVDVLARTHIPTERLWQAFKKTH